MAQFQGISSAPFAKVRSHIRLVASDMDGTLTQHGQIIPMLVQALQDLQAANIPVLVVTGRSAGWVSGLVHYLPVVGAIAENGGLFFPKDNAHPEYLVDIPDLATHRQQLADMFTHLQVHFPQLQESSDNRYRLTDWTFDVQGLSQADLDTLTEQCSEAGWGFTYSTVQCHIKLARQGKATGLLQVLQHHFPHLTPEQVVTIGDSPNDASLFNTDDFPHSVGVANIAHYWDVLNHRPTYVTHAPEAQGFLELSHSLLVAHGRRLLED